MYPDIETDPALKEKIQKIIKHNYNKENQELILSRKHINWGHVLRSRDWSCLKQLCIYDCRVNDHNVKDIIDVSLPNLESFALDDLEHKHLTSEGVRKLMQKAWPKLTSLSLNNGIFGSQGMKMVLNSTKIASLNRLYMSNCRISDQAFTITNSIFANLIEFNISQNNIGRRGVELLVRNQFPLLQSLWINLCGINSEGLENLLKGLFPSLKDLGLTNNNINLSAIQRFGCENNMKSMRYMDIDMEESSIKMLCFVNSLWKQKVNFSNLLLGMDNDPLTAVEEAIRKRFRNDEPDEEDQ